MGIEEEEGRLEGMVVDEMDWPRGRWRSRSRPALKGTTVQIKERRENQGSLCSRSALACSRKRGESEAIRGDMFGPIVVRSIVSTVTGGTGGSERYM